MLDRALHYECVGCSFSTRWDRVHRYEPDRRSSQLTVGVFVGLPVAGRVILDDRPVDAVAQLLVHVHRHLVGDAHEEIHEEPALPARRHRDSTWMRGK